MKRSLFLGVAALVAVLASASATAKPTSVAASGVGSQPPADLVSRVLAELPAEAVARYLDGEDATAIQLGDGTTLEDALLEGLIDTASNSAYFPLNQCVVVKTVAPAAGGKFATNEVRHYDVRGPGTDLSGQGGSPSGCGVAANATATVLNVKAYAAGGNGQVFVYPTGHTSLPSVLNVKQSGTFNNMATVALGSVGDFSVKSSVPVHLVIHTVGYFTPVTISTPLDADTLGGLDSTQFLRSDAMDEYTAGTLQTDSGTALEVKGDLELVAASGVQLPTAGFSGAGPGSGLDADLVDGRDSLDLVPVFDTCLVVSPSCPAAAGDALAARCWTTISAALGAINGTDLPVASATNRYLIRVGPGTYAEQVTMIPNVDIEGAGQKLTTITSAAAATVDAADEAELRRVTVENTLGGTAIRSSGVSPMIRYVTARATGGAAAKAVELGMGAAPRLAHVTTASDGNGVENNDAAVTIRDSSIGGTVNGIENTGAAPTASIVSTQINGGAADGGAGSTFTCLGAYDGTFTELDTNCQ